MVYNPYTNIDDDKAWIDDLATDLSAAELEISLFKEDFEKIRAILAGATNPLDADVALDKIKEIVG